MSKEVWTPLSLPETVGVFSAANFRWWISGGVALEMYVGRSWREHADADIGMCRRDVARLSDVLTGWDIHVAAAGALRQWRGERLSADRHENNLWCRRTAGDPWRLDVAIGEGDDERWIFRRDPAVTRPWSEAVLVSKQGVPYLAPELQLLFKSKDVRSKDSFDGGVVIPALTPERLAVLRELLPANHAWQAML